MNFTLRYLFVAVTLLAIICVVVSPYFLPPRFYTREFEICSFAALGDTYIGNTELAAPAVIRGSGIPTIILGNAGSDALQLGMAQLPFAIVLPREQSGLFSIESTTSLDRDRGPSLTTTITRNEKNIVLEYTLLKGAVNPRVVVESLKIDGTDYDMTKGRLFKVDQQLGIHQKGITKIDKAVFPQYPEGDEVAFANFLEWWEVIRYRL